MIGKDVITFSIQTEVSLTHDKPKVTVGGNSTPNYNLLIPGSELRQHRQRLEGALRNSGEGDDAEAKPVKRDEPVPRGHMLLIFVNIDIIIYVFQKGNKSTHTHQD